MLPMAALSQWLSTARMLRQVILRRCRVPVMEGFGLRTLHWPDQNFPRFVLHSETSYLSFLPSLSLQRIKTVWSLGRQALPPPAPSLFSLNYFPCPVKWVVSTFKNYVKVQYSATLSSLLSPEQWLTALDMNMHSLCLKYITFQLCWFSPATGHYVNSLFQLKCTEVKLSKTLECPYSNWIFHSELGA